VAKRQPVDNNAVYYYHFDGLGSVAALSDSNGDSVQSYEYSVYGQVAAEDPNHPNPYMFTGRRFDVETGLYYYRARYYNPYIGRFLQTDPVGYGDGYCGNNPVGMVDPSGCHECRHELSLYELYYHTFHFTMPSELIDTTRLSLDEIPGKLQDWLGGMAIQEQALGWRVANVTWVSGSDEELDVVFWYPDCYAVDPLPVDEPVLDIKTVGGAKVLTVEGVGMLDDYTLNNIMAPWFKNIMAQKRWNWTIQDWYDDMLDCAVTPFRKHRKDVKNWKYGRKIYDNSEVNYVGLGFGAAHFLSPLHLSAKFRIVNRKWPFIWNFWNYGHLPGPDQFWFEPFALFESACGLR